MVTSSDEGVEKDQGGAYGEGKDQQPLEVEKGEQEKHEGEGADEHAAPDVRKAPTMKNVAKAVVIFGGMALCPKVDTLQSQVCAGVVALFHPPF